MRRAIVVLFAVGTTVASARTGAAQTGVSTQEAGGWYVAPRMVHCANTPLGRLSRANFMEAAKRQGGPATPEDLYRAAIPGPTVLAELDLARCLFLGGERSAIAEVESLLESAIKSSTGLTQNFIGFAPALRGNGPGGALRVTGPTPARVSGAVPAYPVEARAAGIGGLVFLDVVVETDGTVGEARVVGSIPELDAAALAAVRQWKYEPPLVDGKPSRVVKVVSVRFSEEAAIGPVDFMDLARFYAAHANWAEAEAALHQAVASLRTMGPPIRLGTPEAANIVAPKAVRNDPAVYPPVARMAQIRGSVLLDVTVNRQGDVTDVKVAKTVHGLLDQSAVMTVRQWKYTPALLDGQPVAVILQVSVTFP